jgi:hypothetical protein
MDVRRDAGRASASEGATTMAEETTTLRRCIGSARFGIEPHEAPVEDFPAQPSQKDGLGRMCRVHGNAYTAGLARDAKARKAADAAPATEDEATAQEQPPSKPTDLEQPAAEPNDPEQPAARKRTRRTSAREAEVEAPAE